MGVFHKLLLPPFVVLLLPFHHLFLPGWGTWMDGWWDGWWDAWMERTTTASISCTQIMNSVTLVSSIHWQSFGQQKGLWPLFMSKLFWVFKKKITFICSWSLLTMNWLARRTSRTSFSLLGEVLKTIIVIPKVFPNLIAMWPKPPKSTTPKCLPTTSIW